VANEFREIRDYLFGTLTNAATISDTTITCSDFTVLPTTYTTGRYLPLVLHDPALKLYEVVWVTAHSAASASVTVVRAKEGSTARAWPSGSQVLCAPTVRDGLPVTTRASLPSDANIGQRYSLTDESVVVQRLATTWGPSVGVCQASEAGPRRSGTIPSTAVITMRGGHKTGTANASGLVTITHAVAFTTATIVSTIALVDADTSCVPAVSSETAAGVTFIFYKCSDGLPVANGTGVEFQYLSIGY